MMAESLPDPEYVSALLIDDDVPLLESWQRIAAIDGIVTVCSSTWDDGLDMFQIYSPPLVVVDYSLPDSRHGLQLITAMRRLRPSVRLVLISGLVAERQLESAVHAGVVDRAIAKGDPSAAVDALRDELRQAAHAAMQPTDWKSFADAYVRSTDIDSAVLCNIDSLMLSQAKGR